MRCCPGKLLALIPTWLWHTMYQHGTLVSGTEEQQHPSSLNFEPHPHEGVDQYSWPTNHLVELSYHYLVGFPANGHPMLTRPLIKPHMGCCQQYGPFFRSCEVSPKNGEPERAPASDRPSHGFIFQDPLVRFHVWWSTRPFDQHHSRGTFPILSRDPSFKKTSGNPEKTVFFERTMVEKNGEGITP